MTSLQYRMNSQRPLPIPTIAGMPEAGVPSIDESGKPLTEEETSSCGPEDDSYAFQIYLSAKDGLRRLIRKKSDGDNSSDRSSRTVDALGRIVTRSSSSEGNALFGYRDYDDDVACSVSPFQCRPLGHAGNTGNAESALALLALQCIAIVTATSAISVGGEIGYRMLPNGDNDQPKTCKVASNGSNHIGTGQKQWRNHFVRKKFGVTFLATALVSSAALGAYFGIQDPGEEERLSLLLSANNDNRTAPFRGNLTGTPFAGGGSAHTPHTATGGFGNSENLGSGEEETKNARLQFLVVKLSPIVSEISELGGYDLLDYISSRRNDDTIVFKGSPQHSALAWLSRAVRCRRRETATATTTTTNTPFRGGEGRLRPPDYYQLRYECETALSRSQIVNRYVLATMYFAWNGKLWTDSEGWMSYDSFREDSVQPTTRSSNSSSQTTILPPNMASHFHHPNDICSWKGITCRLEQTIGGVAPIALDGQGSSDNKGSETERETGAERSDENIVELSLPGNNLIGLLPRAKEIRLLSELEVLDLSGNHLGGTIPEEIGRLARLRELLLQGNRLSGVLPSAVAGTRLDVARLEDNLLASGLDRLLLSPPCEEAPREFSADCAGRKPRVACPCCTLCCGAAPSLENAKETETIVCSEYQYNNPSTSLTSEDELRMTQDNI